MSRIIMQLDGKFFQILALWMLIAIMFPKVGDASPPTFPDKSVYPKWVTGITTSSDSDDKENDFSTWHWPVPMGEYQIVRGPCGFSDHSHGCSSYEEKCSFDIAPQANAPKITPVLAPYEGLVTFIGLLESEAYPGVAAVIEHLDGRTSVFYQMSKLVVETNQWVEQGEVIGYFDTSKDTSSALHFFVQPNPIEQKCTSINGLDIINNKESTLASFNKLWYMLTLTNPPQPLLEVLPPVIIADVGKDYDTRIRLTPNQRANIWVLLIGKLRDTPSMRGPLGELSTVIKRTEEGASFKVSLESYGAMAGYNATYFFPDTPQANGLSFWLYFEVTRPINLIPNNGVLAESPKVIAPTNQSKWKETPEFCWEAPVNGGKSPIKYLVRIIGANQLYSGWIADTCWHPATPLPTGSYTWKVIAKDKRGYMNPPNQNPYTFKIISRLMMDYE